jgi:hypothetical protein
MIVLLFYRRVVQAENYGEGMENRQINNCTRANPEIFPYYLLYKTSASGCDVLMRMERFADSTRSNGRFQEDRCFIRKPCRQHKMLLSNGFKIKVQIFPAIHGSFCTFILNPALILTPKTINLLFSPGILHILPDILSELGLSV